MSLRRNLFTLASLGQSFYSKWLMRRIVLGIALLMILALVTAMLVSALLVSCAYTVYFMLVNYGMEPARASLSATGVLFLIVLAMGGAIWGCIRYIKGAPKQLLASSPLIAHATEMVDGFLDGFLQEDA